MTARSSQDQFQEHPPVHEPRFDPWPAARERVLALVDAPSPLLVVSDFDGTLAPISHDPMGTRIDPLGRSALRRLARWSERHPERLRLAILSGRGALDVATRVRVGGLRYLGNHGLEGGSLARRQRPESLRPESDPRFAGFWAPARAFGAAVADRLDRPEWLLVEEKGPSVAFHFRQAPDPASASELIAGAVARTAAADGSGGLVRFDGRKVIEFRPEGAGGKGAALARLIDEERPGCVLVLGDDRSDAEAFRALAELREPGGPDGLAVAVHGAIETPPEVVEAADLLLPAPRDACRLLCALARGLEAG